MSLLNIIGRYCVRKRFNHKGNFTLHPYTLVEMLVVMAIIAILIGVGAGGYKVGRRWLAKSQTEAILAKLKIAIESYKNDKGYYPMATNVAVPFKLDTNSKDGSSLAGDEHKVLRNMNNFVDYATIQADQSYKHSSGGCTYYYVKDGWTAPLKTPVTLVGPTTIDSFGAIKYRSPGLINKTSFDLYSAGPDRKFASDPATDTEDDIYVNL